MSFFSKKIVRFVWLTLLVFSIGSAFHSSSAFAQGKSILVIAPHEDDEALCCSGVIYSNVKAGNTVTVAVVTNGEDYASKPTTAAGYTREAETIAAMTGLGVSANHVVFLGYGDQSLQQLLFSTSSSQVYTSLAGQTATYANAGLGGVSYHQYVTGSAGSYTQATIFGDFVALLKNFAPTDIYTTGYWDDHPDHRAVYAFTSGALIFLKKQGLLPSTKIHETWIHAPCEYCDSSYTWPEPVFSPTSPFPQPEDIGVTPYSWAQIENIPVPAVMQDTNQSTNLKWNTIAQYHSQTGDNPASYLFAFVKIGEFFWVRDFETNVAVLATATASTQTTTGWQGAMNAIDGIIGGVPDPLENALNYSSFSATGGGEWVTTGELGGAWIKLTWPSSVTTSRVTLYGRPDGVDNVLSGTLTFSDGSSIPVGALPVGGLGYPITFASKTITWMQFTVNTAQGTNIGLSEIEVHGALTNSVNTYSPQMHSGPVAVAPAIAANQSTTLTADSFGIYGYPLTYNWSVNGGSISGSGPSVTFTPPATGGTYTGTVTVSDGHGGVVQNSGFITVCSMYNPANSESLFTTQTPTITGKSDGVNLELGMLFQSDTAGQITGIRFWKDASETGLHTGTIWSASGTRLASVTFCNETASGWQVQSLATPLSINANTTYVVSVNTGDTYYVDSNGGLASSITNMDLSNVVTANNGVYGPQATFPTSSWANSNYFRDVVFVSSANGTYNLSGTITGVSGATVTLSSNGSTVATLISGGAGSTYTFNNVPNGSYTVSASLAGYTFTPGSASVTVNGANATATALVAAANTYSLTGTINGVAGATVTLSSNGATVATLTSGASGSTYSFSNVANGSYTVTPSLAGYNFSPTSASVTVNGANATASTFTATAKTYAILGTVTGVAGATVTLSSNGATVATLTSGASGSTYSFNNVANGSYTVTPSLAGYNFNPTSASVTVNGANATASTFTATKTYAISGTVTGVAGATVTLTSNGATVATLTSGASGATFTFSNVPNGNYIVTPSLAGYTFSPTSASLTVNGANATTSAFTGTVKKYSVSGTITGVSGATLLLSSNGATVATLTSGSSGSTYSFSNVANGNYTVTPILSGHSFSPTSAAITVNGSNVTVSTFVASSQTYTVSGSLRNTFMPSLTLSVNGTTVATVTAGWFSNSYSFSKVANGTYTVTPSEPGFTFSPSTATITVNGGSATVPTITGTFTGMN
jgi:LmbE family N-acetylglucosaminyl deacetylase